MWPGRLSQRQAQGHQYELAASAYLRRRRLVPVDENFRCKGGEIDLIMRRGDEYVFVEVKKAARHGYAAERISRRQMDRICNAALEFCAEMAQGLMTLMRFDAALVDQFGRVEVIENAFGAA